MTVELLRFRNGYRLNPDIDFEAQVERMVSTYENSFIPLKEEEYDLTSDDTHRHQLVVLGNGKGVYRLLPLSFTEGREGGKPIQVSEPDHIIFITNYSPETGQHRVFDVVRYVPGSSPK